MPTSPPDAPSSFHPYDSFDEAPRAPRPASAAPPLGVRPIVDRFGHDASKTGEPNITPQPGQMIAPLRDGLRLGRLGRAAGAPLGGPGSKARA